MSAAPYTSGGGINPYASTWASDGNRVPFGATFNAGLARNPMVSLFDNGMPQDKVAPYMKQNGFEGYPTRGYENRMFPWNGQDMFPTREHQFPFNQILLDITYIGICNYSSYWTRYAAPLIMIEGDGFDVIEAYWQYRKLHSHSWEGPYQSFGYTRARKSFQLERCALGFQIDNSLRGLPLHSWLLTNYMQTMQQSIRSTIYSAVINKFLLQEFVYSREREFYQNYTQQKLRPDDIERKVIDLLENIPGVLNRPDVLMPFGTLISTARRHTDHIKKPGAPDIGYIALSRTVLDNIALDPHILKPNTMPDSYNAKFLQQRIASEDVMKEYKPLLFPLDVGKLGDLAVLPCDKIFGEREGIYDPMMSSLIIGRYMVFDVYKHPVVSAYNIETGTYSEIWRLCDDTTIDFIKKVPGGLETIMDEWDTLLASPVTASATASTGSTEYKKFVADRLRKQKKSELNSAAVLHVAGARDRKGSGVIVPMKDSRYVIAVGNVHLNAFTVLINSPGEKVALTAVGQEQWGNYNVDQLEKSVWTFKMMLGVAIISPECINNFPDAAFANYLYGGTATTLKPNSNVTSMTLHGPFGYYAMNDSNPLNVRGNAYYGSEIHSRSSDISASGDLALFWVPPVLTLSGGNVAVDKTKTISWGQRLSTESRLLDGSGTFPYTLDIYQKDNAGFRWIPSETEQTLKAISEKSAFVQADFDALHTDIYPQLSKREVHTALRDAAAQGSALQNYLRIPEYPKEISDHGRRGLPNTCMWNMKAKGIRVGGDKIETVDIGTTRGPFKHYDTDDLLRAINNGPRPVTVRVKNVTAQGT